jgi:hypothetical protein
MSELFGDLDLEATFDRLDYLLGRRFRPRRPAETPRSYLDAIRTRVGPAEGRLEQLFAMYERAHYAGRSTGAEADRAWRLFDDLRDDWSAWR